MFDKIKRVIDEWDPIELLIIHCPPDEYDEISMKLTRSLRYNRNIESLEKEIYNLFVQAFGITTFTKSRDECRMIAQRIIEINT